MFPFFGAVLIGDIFSPDFVDFVIFLNRDTEAFCHHFVNFNSPGKIASASEALTIFEKKKNPENPEEKKIREKKPRKIRKITTKELFD